MNVNRPLGHILQVEVSERTVRTRKLLPNLEHPTPSH